MKATKMLLRFYTWVLVAGVLAMFTIIIAAMAIVYFKAEKTVRWPSTVIFLIAIPVINPPFEAPARMFPLALQAPLTLSVHLAAQAIFFTLLGLNRDMGNIAKLNESSRVSMGGEDGDKVSLNEDTLGVGRMARNVLSETYARGQRPVKGIAAVLNHLGSKEAAEAQDSDPLEPALIRRSATWTGPAGP